MGLEDVRRRFFSRFPAAEKLDAALRTADNPTPAFFFTTLKDADLNNVGFILVRLGRDLERRFSINGEVGVFLVPWEDFQRRSFNAISGRLLELARESQIATLGAERFTPTKKVALVIGHDRSLEQKLDEWQQDSVNPTLLVSLEIDGSAEGEIIPKLAGALKVRLGDRDLYRTQNPVTGDEFFGRTRLVRDLAAAVFGDENVAILGLRRSGKTSVIRELKRQLMPRSAVVAIADFQMLDSGSVDEVAESIASNLLEELKLAKRAGIDAWVGSDAEQEWRGITLAGLADRLKRVAARNPNLRIVIAVDEVEGAAAIARQNPEAIKTLLGSLRAAAQARDNVSLLFSGVANRLFKSSSLGVGNTVDNPMFSQVTSVYLSLFDQTDTAMLLRDLGRPMFLAWNDEAVAAVHNLTGGFPFFVRDLASTVRQHLSDQRADVSNWDPLNVAGSDVEAVWHEWSDAAGEAWLGIIRSLELHYPAAALLLNSELSEKDVADWVTGDNEAAEAAEDLTSLGLFDRSGARFTFSDSLRALHRLAAGRQVPSGQLQEDAVTEQDIIVSLVRGGETHAVEFKETSRLNIATGVADKRMEDEIVKTVAGFLNADGGSLLVGVSDAGELVGLARDLKLFRNNLDQYERWIKGDLLAKRVDKQIIAEKVSISFVQCRGKRILHIKVRSSEEPAWVDDQVIYLRNGNQTMALTSGRDVARFLQRRSDGGRGAHE